MSRRHVFSTCCLVLLVWAIVLHLGCGGTGSSGGTGTGTSTGISTTTGTGTADGTGSGSTSGSGTTNGTGTGGSSGSTGTSTGTSSTSGSGTSTTSGTGTTSGSGTGTTGGTGTSTTSGSGTGTLSAGKRWKEYSENIPSVGYVGGDSSSYTQHHNPLSYFSDVRADATQRQNLVSFTQFAVDMSNGQLPNFSFVVPSNSNNAHDGSLGQADNWLKQNIDPVLANPQFKQNGLLLIVFDEAEETDVTHGGGQVALVVVGPKVKTAFRSTTFYQHQDLLKMIATYLGIDPNIGDAATASTMSEFFNQ
jgi:Phosphoesterase family